MGKNLVKPKKFVGGRGKNNPMYGRTGKDHPMYGRHHSDDAKRKISEAKKGENHHYFGKKLSEEHRRKISEGNKGKKMSDDAKIKISKGNSGKTPDEKTRLKMAKAKKGTYRNEKTKQKISKTMKHKKINCGDSNPAKRPEVRKKISASTRGENASNWQGGVSFEPYCPKFNAERKNKTRNEYGRTCALCEEMEILNSRRLDVHHVDSDKMQGCGGREWLLVPLCKSCHQKIHHAKEDEQIEYEFILITNSNNK